MKFLLAGRRILRAWVPKRDDKGWCYRHNKFCRYMPPESLVQDGLLADTTGSSCVAWSSAGACDGWLHGTAVPFLIWARIMEASEAHAFVHECVAAFDWSGLRLCLGNVFLIESLVFSPVDQGIPTNRKRRYTVGHHRDKVRKVLPFDIKHFGQVTFRQLQLTGDIFFRADPDTVGAHVRCLALAMGLPETQANGEPWHSCVVMGAGRHMNKEADLARPPPQHRFR